MALNRIERRRRIHYRIRKHVNGTAERPRMVVFRSNKQIYVQVVNDQPPPMIRYSPPRQRARAVLKLQQS